MDDRQKILFISAFYLLPYIAYTDKEIDRKII
jgi:hypothetical protein